MSQQQPPEPPPAPAVPTRRHVEWFAATGRGTGLLILALWVVMAVLGIANGMVPALLALLLIAAALTHVTLLRPRVGTTAHDLVLRQMFSDLAIPLASIDGMRIDRYFEARVAERRYVSPALGRSRRRARANARSRGQVQAGVVLGGWGATAAGASSASGTSGTDPRDRSSSAYADLVEDTLRARVADARAQARSQLRSPAPEQAPDHGVRRRWAWGEIAAGATAVVIFAICLVA